MMYFIYKKWQATISALHRKCDIMNIFPDAESKRMMVFG